MTREPWEDKLDAMVAGQVESYDGLVTPDAVIDACAAAWSPPPPSRFVTGEFLATGDYAFVSGGDGRVYRGTAVAFEGRTAVAVAAEFLRSDRPCWLDRHGRLWATEARADGRGRVKVAERRPGDPTPEEAGACADRDRASWAFFERHDGEPWFLGVDDTRSGGDPAYLTVRTKGPRAEAERVAAGMTAWDGHPVRWDHGGTDAA